ncbi:MAG: protease inhibitor I42 family protein [Methanotrichaceae archaeon]
MGSSYRHMLLFNLLALFLALLLALPVIPAQAEIRVCNQGCNQSSIQSAIDAMNVSDITNVSDTTNVLDAFDTLGSTDTADTITVESGTYSDDLKIDKPVTLHGIDTGGGRPIFSRNSIVITADGFVLRGFEIADERSLDIEGSGYIFLNNFPASEGILVESRNFWNSSQPINYQFESKVFRSRMGNYWADYTGKDENHDGIGDVPKVIDSHNVDYYPLMQPVQSYSIEGEKEDRMDTIRAKLNQPFTISLESNPTTGYKWYADYDYDLLRLDSQNYERSPSSAIGGGGIDVLTFTPLRSGQTKISLVYRRPWENIAGNVRTFLVEVP